MDSATLWVSSGARCVRESAALVIRMIRSMVMMVMIVRIVMMVRIGWRGSSLRCCLLQCFDA